jgi:hypothetical protein
MTEQQAAWQSYQDHVLLEDLAWDSNRVQRAIARGRPLPHVYRVAAARTGMAWQQYLKVRRG